jgi:hypothetical protein
MVGAALGGGASASTRHGYTRGEHLHNQGVTVELPGLRKKRQNGEGGPATCKALRQRWQTHGVMALQDDKGPIGSNISSGHSSRSRTLDVLARREKEGANIEREDSPTMVAKVECTPR